MAPPPARTLSRAEIEERIDTLPTLPSVVTEIMGLDPASEEFHLRVRELAFRDPPFAVRIIARPLDQRANRIFSGLARRTVRVAW